ncbi:MAG: hypothetical protein M3Z01_06940 [Thermoproteota archaeon]|nr:hypothetical protein [Thermoproteota archaeon]
MLLNIKNRNPAELSAEEKEYSKSLSTKKEDIDITYHLQNEKKYSAMNLMYLEIN